MFNNFFPPENRAGNETWEKILYSQTGHRWQYNMAQALGLWDN